MARTRKTAEIINLTRALLDRSYRWKDRDPDLEEVCNMITASGMSTYNISQRISKETGGAFSVSPATMDRWLGGQVKKPQNFTMTWVAFALGYERAWTKIR